MDVLIENRQNRFDLSSHAVQKSAATILNALGCPDAQLSVLIVDDQQIAELNNTYLHHSGPTNVISFPMQEGPFTEISPDLLGDVVISAETAQREAADAGLDFTHRFHQLLIHGILHLLGYDHVNSNADAEIMEQKSEQLMRLIGKEN